MKYQVQENCLTIFLPEDVDHHNAEEIKREADRLIDREHIRYIIFDFADTGFMDSSGIALILKTDRRMRQCGGRASIANPAKQPLRVLDASGIERMIPVRGGSRQ